MAEDNPTATLRTFLVKCGGVNEAKNIYIGIDPGATGAIGFNCGRRQCVVDIPTITVATGAKTKRGNKKHKTVANYAAILAIFRLLKDFKDRVRVVVEHAIPMSRGGGGQSAVVAFRVGIAFGMWPLFLTSRGYQFTEVFPVKWKRDLGLLGKDKEYSRMQALHLWPEADILRKKDHDRAEALLLAFWLRRSETGNGKEATR